MTIRFINRPINNSGTRIFAAALGAGLLTALFQIAGLAETPYETKTFVSQIDNREDFYAYALPKEPPSGPLTLIVFFHGVTQDFTEPFKEPIAEVIMKKYPSLAIMSSNFGRRASWGTRNARIDVTHNIQEFSQSHPVDKIILMGTSMGASVAMNYAACAPKELRKKIIGIVAVCPVPDLAVLHTVSLGPIIKSSMEKSFKGTPEDKPAEYHIASLDANIVLFPTDAKVYLIDYLQDIEIPAKLVRTLERSLRVRDVNFKTVELPGILKEPLGKDLNAGLKFILEDSDAGENQKEDQKDKK
jgi:pimeloyl-ACP methyl ester carboxylesterase